MLFEIWEIVLEYSDWEDVTTFIGACKSEKTKARLYNHCLFQAFGIKLNEISPLICLDVFQQADPAFNWRCRVSRKTRHDNDSTCKHYTAQEFNESWTEFCGSESTRLAQGFYRLKIIADEFCSARWTNEFFEYSKILVPISKLIAACPQTFLAYNEDCVQNNDDPHVYYAGVPRFELREPERLPLEYENDVLEYNLHMLFDEGDAGYLYTHCKTVSVSSFRSGKLLLIAGDPCRDEIDYLLKFSPPFTVNDIRELWTPCINNYLKFGIQEDQTEVGALSTSFRVQIQLRRKAAARQLSDKVVASAKRLTKKILEESKLSYEQKTELIGFLDDLEPPHGKWKESEPSLVAWEYMDDDFEWSQYDEETSKQIETSYISCYSNKTNMRGSNKRSKKKFVMLTKGSYFSNCFGRYCVVFDTMVQQLRGTKCEREVNRVVCIPAPNAGEEMKASNAPGASEYSEISETRSDYFSAKRRHPSKTLEVAITRSLRRLVNASTISHLLTQMLEDETIIRTIYQECSLLKTRSNIIELMRDFDSTQTVPYINNTGASLSIHHGIVDEWPLFVTYGAIEEVKLWKTHLKKVIRLFIGSQWLKC